MDRLVLIIFAFSLFIISGCGYAGSNLDTPPTASAAKSTVNEISAGDALPKIQAAYSQFVDVRTAEEYAGGHAVRAISIPLESLTANLDRIERGEPVYLICDTGDRSHKAGKILTDAGYKWIFVVTGGTAAWQKAGLPMEMTKR